MAREIINDVSKIIKILFSISVGLVVFLVLFSILPNSWQNFITDKTLQMFGQYEVTTTEIYSEVEEFQEEPRFILGFQYINDSIVTKTKKPFCDPAYYKVFIRRKANYIYEIQTGEMEIVFSTDTVYYRDEPNLQGTYCATQAPKLPAETLQKLQDSILLSYPLEMNKTEEELKALVGFYIQKEHVHWKNMIKP